MAVINTTYEDFVYGYNNDTLRDGDYRFLYETIVPSTVTAYKASGLQFYITISVTYDELTATSSFNNLVKQIERVNSADLPGANLDLWQVYWNETGEDGTKGWIYSLKDEWDNIAPYDFKSIQFLDGENYVYTFDDGASGDLSVTQTTLCRDNRIYGSDTKSYAVYSTRDYIQKIILRPDTDTDEVKYNNIVYTNQNIIVKGEFNTIYENCNNVTLVGDHNTLKAGNDVIDINGNSNTLGENNENITIQGDENILGSNSKDVTIVGNSNQVDESTTVVITGDSNAVSGSTDTTITGQGNTVSGSTTTVIEGNNNDTYDSTQTDIKGDGNATSDSSGTTIVDGDGNTISGSTDTTITGGDDITVNPGNTDTDLDGDDSGSTIDQTDQGKIETKPDGSQTDITDPDDPKETSTDPIQEAPIDNEPYVRRNKDWSKLVAGDNITIVNSDDEQTTTISSTAGIEDAPSDGKTYGRKDATWTEVTGGTEYTAGQNIGITDNKISALGYTYDADLNSFTTLGDTPKSNAVSIGKNNSLNSYTTIIGLDNTISDNIYSVGSAIVGYNNNITSEDGTYARHNTIVGYINTSNSDNNTIIGINNTAISSNNVLLGEGLKDFGATGTASIKTIVGRYNAQPSYFNDIFIVGGGSSDTSRKNLLTINSNGLGTFSSDVIATKSDGTTVSLIDVASSSYDDTKVVHKEGGETVSGAKEFTGANTYAKALRLVGTDWSTSTLQSATANIYIYPNFDNNADKAGWCFDVNGSFRPDSSNTKPDIGTSTYGLSGIYMRDGNSLIRSNTEYLGFGNKNGNLFSAYSTKGGGETVTTGALYPLTNDKFNLGTTSLKWKDAYLSGVLHVPTIGTSANNLTLLSGSEQSQGGFLLKNTDQEGGSTFEMTTEKTVLTQLTSDSTYSALTLNSGALTLESEAATTISSNSSVAIGSYQSNKSSTGYYSGINLSSSTIDLNTSYKTSSTTTTKAIRFGYGVGALYPTSSNSLNLGTTNYRWKYIYSNNALQVSDKREKKDIEQIDLQRCKDWVDNTNAYTFKYNDDEEQRQRVGLIAQEVQQYIPEAVVEADDEKKTLSLGYSDLVAPLLAVVKDLRKEVAELKERVAKLEAEKVD